MGGAEGCGEDGEVDVDHVAASRVEHVEDRDGAALEDPVQDAPLGGVLSTILAFRI